MSSNITSALGTALIGPAKLVNSLTVKKRRPLIDGLISKSQSAVVPPTSPLPEELSNIVEATSVWVKRSVGLVQTFKQEKIDPFFVDRRNQHLKAMSLDEVVISKESQFAIKQLKFHTVLLASMSVCVLIYPPLLLLHVPPMIYLAIPMYKQGYRELKERGVTTTVVDVCLSLGSLGYVFGHMGILLVGEVGGLVFSFTQKIVAQSKDGTRQQLTNLFGQQPKTVWVLQNGVEVEVPFETVQTGDLVVIDAGQMIPVDGMIQEGVASIDQHMLTGESQPAEKGIGDPALAATVVLAGRIIIRVEKTGAETSAMQVGQILSATSSFTSSLQLRGKEIADRAAGPTLLLSLVAWPLVGAGSALAILLSGMGRTMRILGPLSVLNFLQLTAQEGILIKDGRALEQVGAVDTVVFDKTGTLTQERPYVGRLFTCHGYDEQQLLTYAAAAEHRQTHPIARAILAEAAARGVVMPTISAAAYEIGYGIQVTVANQRICVGSHRFMVMEGISIPAEIEAIRDGLQAEGQSLVYVAANDQLAGVIELVPTVRPEAKRIVDYLHRAGLKTIIISGDHERPTRALAASLGIDRYFAETLPENKANLIVQLQSEGKTVCFVGDGINDSIALKKANVSVSLRGASTVATDTAQIILMDQTLNDLQTLFEFSEKFEVNMRGNLMSSILPGAIIIGGAFAGIIGYSGALSLFALGMVAGVANAMLPRFHSHDTGGGQQEPIKESLPETSTANGALAKAG